MVRRLLDPTVDIADDERASGASLLTRREDFDAPPIEPAPLTSSTPQPARARRWRGDIAAIVFLLVIAIAATWPLARHPASTLPDLGDPLDSAWRLSWPIHQLMNGGPDGLLDANTYYPFRSTYLFDELILGVAIVVAPVVALTGNGVLAFNVALLIAFAMNGIAAYALLRHLTGSQIAAIGGALPFAVAPFRFVHTGHIGLSTAFWLPLALLFLDRLLLRPRWRDAALFGLCAAFQALSAQYYGFQLAIVVGIYLLWAAVRRPRLLFNWAFLGRLFFAVVLAELLLLPIVGPYVGVKGTWGYSRGLEENELYSATASSFLAAPPANPIGERIAARARAALGITSWNLWFYPGLGSLLLAIAGAVRARRRWTPPDWREARGEDPPDLYSFFVTLGLFGAAMCLGPTLHLQQIDQGDGVTRLMPYRALFHLVPLFDAMRAPERFGNVVLLGLSGAVGFGVAGIVARLPRRAPSGRGRLVAWRIGRVVLAALLIAIVGAEYLRAPLRVAAVPATPPVYEWLAAQPPGPVLELPLGNPPGEVNREQVRQYWSTRNWLPRVNGSSDIAPRAYGALRQDLATFPDPRGLGILQALGVRYLVIHRAQYTPADWEELKPRLAAYAVTIPQRAEFGDDLVLELQPDARFARLQALIPPDTSVFLGDHDPRDTDAYMTTLGWLLAGENRRLITRIIPTYGVRYERPSADVRADWLIAYKGEGPAAYGYPAGMTLAYEDNVVQVYRR